MSNSAPRGTKRRLNDDEDERKVRLRGGHTVADLIDVCRHNDLDKVKAILRDQPELSHAYRAGSTLTPLSAALSAQHIDIIKYLVETHCTPIVYKVPAQCFECSSEVKRLLDDDSDSEGSDPNDSDSKDPASVVNCEDCPMYPQCHEEKIQLHLDALVRHHHDLTPVSTKIALYMAKKAFEQNYVYGDPNFGLELLTAVTKHMRGRALREMMEFLVEQKGVVLSNADPDRFNFMHNAVFRTSTNPKIGADLVTYLLAHGASMNQSQQVKFINHAIYTRNTLLAMALMGKGSGNGIDLKNHLFNEHYNNLFHAAARTNMLDLVEFMVKETPVDVHWEDMSGDNVVCVLCRSGEDWLRRKKLIRYLVLERGVRFIRMANTAHMDLGTMLSYHTTDPEHVVKLYNEFLFLELFKSISVSRCRPTQPQENVIQRVAKNKLLDMNAIMLIKQYM